MKFLYSHLGEFGVKFDVKTWNWRSLLSCAVVLTVWQAACELGWIETNILPPPTTVLTTLGSLMRSGEIFTDAGVSLRRVLVGFSGASILGIAFGTLAAVSRRFRYYVTPLVEVLRPIPPVAFVPISVMWFGIGDRPAYFLVSLGAFFPIFTNAWAGVLSISPLHREAALALGANRRLMLTDVILPGAMPYLLAGLRTGLGTAWFCVIVAELVGAQSGLGYMIQLNRLTLQSEKVLCGMVVIGFLGYVMNRLMGFVQGRLTPWRRELA